MWEKLSKGRRKRKKGENDEDDGYAGQRTQTQHENYRY